jgi:hypothetical protein
MEFSSDFGDASICIFIYVEVRDTTVYIHASSKLGVASVCISSSELTFSSLGIGFTTQLTPSLSQHYQLLYHS